MYTLKNTLNTSPINEENANKKIGKTSIWNLNYPLFSKNNYLTIGEIINSLPMCKLLFEKMYIGSYYRGTLFDSKDHPHDDDAIKYKFVNNDDPLLKTEKPHVHTIVLFPMDKVWVHGDDKGYKEKLQFNDGNIDKLIENVQPFQRTKQVCNYSEYHFVEKLNSLTCSYLYFNNKIIGHMGDIIDKDETIRKDDENGNNKQYNLIGKIPTIHYCGGSVAVFRPTLPEVCTQIRNSELYDEIFESDGKFYVTTQYIRAGDRRDIDDFHIGITSVYI